MCVCVCVCVWCVCVVGEGGGKESFQRPPRQSGATTDHVNVTMTAAATETTGYRRVPGCRGEGGGARVSL